MTGMFKSWKFYAIVALLLCGLVTTYAVTRKPRPKSDKPEDIARFVASDGFKKLSDDEQKAYMRQMRPPRGANREDMRKRMDSLTEAERQAMFRNMHELRERERIAELLSPKRSAKNISMKKLRKKTAVLPSLKNAWLSIAHRRLKTPRTANSRSVRPVRQKPSAPPS